MYHDSHLFERKHVLYTQELRNIDKNVLGKLNYMHGSMMKVEGKGKLGMSDRPLLVRVVHRSRHIFSIQKATLRS